MRLEFIVTAYILACLFDFPSLLKKFRSFLLSDCLYTQLPTTWSLVTIRVDPKHSFSLSAFCGNWGNCSVAILCTFCCHSIHHFLIFTSNNYELFQILDKPLSPEFKFKSVPNQVPKSLFAFSSAKKLLVLWQAMILCWRAGVVMRQYLKRNKN